MNFLDQTQNMFEDYFPNFVLSGIVIFNAKMINYKNSSSGFFISVMCKLSGTWSE